MSAGTERPDEGFVQRSLAGTRFAQVRWVPETGSTNDDLLALARQGAGEQVLITDLQTTGRGRRGRVWEAPSGSGILMSILIRGRRIEDGFWSVGAVALAASEVFGEIVDSPCTLKWPNDVLLGSVGQQKKMAGILSQVVDDAVVVGIGINVNWPEDVPEEMSERGVAANQHSSDGAFLPREPLVVEILQRAMCHLADSPENLRANWKARCSTLGQQVRVERESESIIGDAVDIASDGALILDQNGVRTTHQVGDVVHLRPAKT